MDEVFGSENFVSLIIFKKTSGASEPTYSPASYDYVALVREGPRRAASTASCSCAKRVEAAAEPVRLCRAAGRRSTAASTRGRVARGRAVPTGACVSAARRSDMPASRRGPQLRRSSSTGRHFRPPAAATGRRTETGMERLAAAGSAACAIGNTLRYVRYLDDFPVVPLNEPLGRHVDERVRGRQGLRRPDEHEGRSSAACS